jgi:hypothetical protein
MIYNHRKVNLADTKPTDDLGINDLIDRVSVALSEREKKRIDENRDALFEVKKFDLEINFVVKKADTHRGGLELKVVTAGAEAQYSSETIQKIMLHMETIKPEKKVIPLPEGPPPSTSQE